MTSKVITANLDGLQATPVEVEAEILNGFSAFYIVGLPNASIKESKERIRSAFLSSGYKMPLGRIVINLVPADLRKYGTHYDLPIALGLLEVMGDFSFPMLSSIACLGELSLDGRIQKVNGVLAMLLALREKGIHHFIIPEDNVMECRLVEDITLYAYSTFQKLVQDLQKNQLQKAYFTEPLRQTEQGPLTDGLDFSDVKGQEGLKRIIEISAAGNHSLLVMGPPGVGKTMSLTRMQGILPPLTEEECLELTKIYSACGLLHTDSVIRQRPFRMPHYTISDVGLIGGGQPPFPGEITLAHHGILYLDELAEFSKKQIDFLRVPMESHTISLSKGRYRWEFPAHFLLIASMNPCPCGRFGSRRNDCTCTMAQIMHYRSKVSKPMLDRFDLQWEAEEESSEGKREDDEMYTTEKMRARVICCREIQKDRFGKMGFYTNADIPDDINMAQYGFHDQLDLFLQAKIRKYGLSFRTYRKIIKIARTIADLDNKEKIEESHLLEAIQYKLLGERIRLINK